MTIELHSYKHGGESFDLAVSRPSAAGEQRAVLVFHAWRGRSEFEECVAGKLSALGYVGIAVDLYGVGRRGTDVPSCQTLMSALTNDPKVLRSRIEAALAEASRLASVDASNVSAVGYCFGGLCALLAARMGLPMRGVVSFHGLLKVGDSLDSKPRAKMLVLHGQNDPMVPTADIAAFAEEMRRVDGDWQLHVYPHTMHAFTNPNANDPAFGTVYNVDADRRSWSAMRGFLASVSKDGP